VGAALLCYSPLECGILAGSLLGLSPGDTRWPDRGPLFEPRNARAIHAALRDAVEPIARDRGATIAQVALAWLLARPAVAAVICGASSSEQLAENAGVPQLQLEPDEVELLARRFARVRIRDPHRAPLARARRWLSRRIRRAAGQ
jgi:aryl-alcohol dehydrogenase-like predicted oxidoreductase